PGRDLCLDVITIALNQACSGQHPYVSTKNLQLASLQFCLACRFVSTLHVKVGRGTPKRLWATPVEEASTAVSRVPLLRARAVTCMGSAPAHFMCSENDVLSNVKHFRGDFNQPIERVAWPASLKGLEFGERFDQPIERVAWPASLQEISFDGKFDQPIEHVVWPISLQHIRF
ncbi:unnamed protein product, partial [Sphacelaria rigidula]